MKGGMFERHDSHPRRTASDSWTTPTDVPSPTQHVSPACGPPEVAADSSAAGRAVISSERAAEVMKTPMPRQPQRSARPWPALLRAPSVSPGRLEPRAYWVSGTTQVCRSFASLPNSSIEGALKGDDREELTPMTLSVHA